jgi:carboxylesterase type B
VFTCPTTVPGSALDQNGTFIVLGSNSTMIVVTINYRLNVFGFLGNAAMRSRDPARNTTGIDLVFEFRAVFSRLPQSYC